LFRLEENDRFRAVLREASEVAEDLFRKGLPLIGKVDRRLSVDLDLFSRGGLKILEKIKMQDYEVLRKRPYISKTERAGILLRCLPRLLPF
jgi:phytoene/squalene synthetase